MALDNEVHPEDSTESFLLLYFVPFSRAKKTLYLRLLVAPVANETFEMKGPLKKEIK